MIAIASGKKKYENNFCVASAKVYDCVLFQVRGVEGATAPT